MVAAGQKVTAKPIRQVNRSIKIFEHLFDDIIDAIFYSLYLFITKTMIYFCYNNQISEILLYFTSYIKFINDEIIIY